MSRTLLIVCIILCLHATSSKCKEVQSAIELKLNTRQRLNQLLFSRIRTDLAPWQHRGITLQDVERTYCTLFKGGFIDGGFRVQERLRASCLQSIEGELYVVGEIPGYPEFNHHVKLFLFDVARHHKLPDFDLVLSTSDACHQPGAFNGSTRKCPTMAPLFAYGKRKEDSHCVLYPDHTFAGWPVVNLPSWQDVWDLMEGKQQHSWEGRKDKLFFRGAKTGLRSYVANDSHFMSSAEVDVKFSGWTGDASQPFYSLPEHCDYRYLLHLPGQAYSSRLKNLLLCKSPVIFPRDGNDEFWYHMLEDGVNAVTPEALSYDVGGQKILSALHELQKDHKKAQRIAAAGHELVRRALRPENVRRYFAELIRAYAALQKFHPTQHPDAVPIEISALSPDKNTTQQGRTCNVCA